MAPKPLSAMGLAGQQLLPQPLPDLSPAARTQLARAAVQLTFFIQINELSIPRDMARRLLNDWSAATSVAIHTH
jgi:hypothetical protein